MGHLRKYPISFQREHRNLKVVDRLFLDEREKTKKTAHVFPSGTPSPLPFSGQLGSFNSGFLGLVRK